jgi:hypothetical protein
MHFARNGRSFPWTSVQRAFIIAAATGFVGLMTAVAWLLIGDEGGGRDGQLVLREVSPARRDGSEAGRKPRLENFLLSSFFKQCRRARHSARADVDVTVLVLTNFLKGSRPRWAE